MMPKKSIVRSCRTSPTRVTVVPARNADGERMLTMDVLDMREPMVRRKSERKVHVEEMVG
jgi:hypothetical protein